MSKKVVAVVGPTASGKTALSLRLAEEVGGEILSCDSMQVYRGMDIGTAKPTAEEQALVPHHLIDLVPPDRPFSCADYKPLAEAALADVLSRGRVPIFCGGTGLYLDAVLTVGSFSPSVPPEIRKELLSSSPEALWEELSLVDPESAASIHKNNVKRVIRALEIYRGTGKTKTEWDRLSRRPSPAYDALRIGLFFSDRDALYRRIEARVDEMLAQGLVEEVRALRSSLSPTASQAIGYKEILLFLDGVLSYDEAVELLKKNTRHYAKRQLTWFRRDPDTVWFPADGRDSFKDIVTVVKKHLTD